MKTTPVDKQQLDGLSDETLIQLALDGKELAYTLLVRRHERLVRHVLQRYFTDTDAVKDVQQETFAKAFRMLHRFRGDSKFSTWLCKIAMSQAVNRLRSRRYAAWDALDDALAHWQEDLDRQEAALGKREGQRLLRQAVQRLNPNDATALDLFYFREQSIEEIGRITGWTNNNIKSRLSRARQRLHGLLTKEGIDIGYFG